MATDIFAATSDDPEMGVIQAALNGMDAIENVLCRMRSLALIAQAAKTCDERRELARRFDQFRRDLDFIAAGTLGIGKACGDCQIFPAEYQNSGQAMIAVCEADGNDRWLRLAGLPPYCHFPADERTYVEADDNGNLDLTQLTDISRKNAVFDNIYGLLNGDTVLVRSAVGLSIAVNQTSHPDLRLYIHAIHHGWAEPFGYTTAITVSLEEATAALNGLHATATSFGAYIYRLYLRYGFGDVPANDL
jgi:hypothetical protein